MPLGPDRLRVAHLIETDGPGGAERLVAELARACRRAARGTSSFSRRTAKDGSRGNSPAPASTSKPTGSTDRFRRRAHDRSRPRSAYTGSTSPTATSSAWRCTARGHRGTPACRTSSRCTAAGTTRDGCSGAWRSAPRSRGAHARRGRLASTGGPHQPRPAAAPLAHRHDRNGVRFSARIDSTLRDELPLAPRATACWSPSAICIQ